MLPASEANALPSQFALFTDLHVQRSTLPVCLRVLRKVAEEARARSAGVICLGDFWHAGGLLHTRQLNAVLAELDAWGPEMPVIMIPGNHDQAMRGDPSPLLHALTPLAKGRKGVRVFSRPTLLDNALWVPYGTSAAQLRAACDAATALRRDESKEPESDNAALDAVFCHADIVGGLMNEGVAATVGLLPTPSRCRRLRSTRATITSRTSCPSRPQRALDPLCRLAVSAEHGGGGAREGPARPRPH